MTDRALRAAFTYFDKESVCGDPDTWYDYHGVNITDESNPSAIITSLITDTAITNYLGYIPEAQLPPQPSVAFPLKKKMWYSCDNFRNILAPSPYAKELSVSDMEAWIKWTEDIIKFVKDKIDFFSVHVRLQLISFSKMFMDSFDLRKQKVIELILNQ